MKPIREGKPLGRPMPLAGHFSELRGRILQMLAIFGIFFLSCFLFPSVNHPVVHDLINFLAARFLPAGMKLVYTSPLEPLKVSFMAAFIAGLLLASPLFLYHLYAFLAPGLSGPHRRFVLWLELGCVFFLILGTASTYYLFLPVTLNFILNYGTALNVAPMITLYEFYKFVLLAFLIFGLPFELPMVMGVLGRMNIVSPRAMRRNRKAAYLVLCIFAGIVTPDPTPVSQILLTIPLWVLFEAGLWFAGLLSRAD
jgi:sec-independent protein translocase protein TatC